MSGAVVVYPQGLYNGLVSLLRDRHMVTLNEVVGVVTARHPGWTPERKRGTARRFMRFLRVRGLAHEVGTDTWVAGKTKMDLALT